MNLPLRISALAGLILLVTIAVYVPGLSGPFLLDDYSNFYFIKLENLGLLNLKIALEQYGPLLSSRPLARLTLYLNNYFTGTETATWHKLTNLSIHLMCGVLIYTLSRQLTHKYTSTGRGLPQYIALILMAIWLLHPLQVSTVLYTVQRMAQISTMFTLLAVVTYVFVRQRKCDTGWTNPLLIFIFIPCVGGLAFLAKENAVLIPLYLFIIELFIFKFRSHSELGQRQIFLFYALIFIFTGFIALVYLMDENRAILNYASQSFSLLERLSTQSVVLLFYLRQILVPSLSEMGLMLDDFPLYQPSDPLVIAAVTAHICFITAALLTRKRSPLISLGVIWFYISHLLESTIFPLEMVFEHRNYLALYGPILALTIFVIKPTRVNNTSTTIRWAGLVLYLLVLIFPTTIRIQNWSTMDRFISAQLMYHPHSWRVHNQLAMMAAEDGNTTYALAHMEEADRLRDGNGTWIVNKIMLMCNETLDIDDVSLASNSIKNADRYERDNVLHAVRRIENLYTNGRCPAIQADDLVELTSALLANTYIRKEFLKSHLHARALLANGNIEDAEKFYFRTWELAPNNLNPMLEYVDELLQLMRVADACQTLKLLNNELPQNDEAANNKILITDKMSAHCQ